MSFIVYLRRLPVRRERTFFNGVPLPSSRRLFFSEDEPSSVAVSPLEFFLCARVLLRTSAAVVSGWFTGSTSGMMIVSECSNVGGTPPGAWPASRRDKAGKDINEGVILVVGNSVYGTHLLTEKFFGVILESVALFSNFL